MDVEQCPLPRPEEFANLRGGKKFTTLDFADAFLQMELDQESQSSGVSVDRDINDIHILGRQFIASFKTFDLCEASHVDIKTTGITC